MTQKPDEEVRADLAMEQAIVRALREELSSVDPDSAAADSLRLQLAEESQRLAHFADPTSALAARAGQDAPQGQEGTPHPSPPESPPARVTRSS